MSSPEQPKRPLSAYWLWLGENRESLQKELPGKRAPEVSKLAGERWQAMPADQKQPYDRKAAEAKAAYDEAMQNFKAQGGVVAKRGSKGDKDEVKNQGDEDGGRKRKGKDAPKRPAGGAFGCFLAEKREEVKAQLPAGHKMTDVTKKAAELWKATPDGERSTYEKAYERRLEEYKAAMDEYKSKGGGAAGNEGAESRGKDGEGKGEGATPRKRAAPDTSDSPTTKRSKGRGRCASEAKALEKAELDAAVVAEAVKLGGEYERNLRSLAGRPDVKAAGKSAHEMLTALKGTQGLLHPARRALLGA